MRFQKYLKVNRYKPYKYYYLDYEILRNSITTLRTQEEEDSFRSLLDENLNRVFGFIESKYQEIKRRIKDKVSKDKGRKVGNNKSRKALNKSPHSLKPSQPPSHTSITTTPSHNINTELKSFSEFIRINLTGFKKILKRHDKRTEFKIQKVYKPFLKEKIKKLEKIDELIYDLRKNDKENDITHCPLSFIRKTDKFWVHKDNLQSLKFYINQHLPIYIYEECEEGGKGDSEGISGSKVKGDFSDTPTTTNTTSNNITSIYLDNINFDLYFGRLHKSQGAEAIRIRWYGDLKDKVFIERKRHEESWTGDLSKKLRFQIYEKDLVKFLNGEDVYSKVKEINKENVKDLYEEIQFTIRKLKLKPVVRTFYKRQAYQLKNNNKVRISIDTDLCMIKEKIKENEEGFIEWRRGDIKESKDYEGGNNRGGSNGGYNDTRLFPTNQPPYPPTSHLHSHLNPPTSHYPFPGLKKDQIVRFPYAILEIKTQGDYDSKPEWITDLVEGPLVEHVHKFSKFLHGCAVLYPFINEIPYWLPQVTKSIKKDPFDSEEITNKESDHYENGDLKGSPPQTHYINIPSNNNNIPPNHNNEIDDSDKLSPIDTHGKKIAIPVRVEPKVFFANERTFLSWVQFAIFLGGIGTALLGMKEGTSSKMPGVLLIGVSIIFSFYALYLYLWRAGMIRKRHPGPYDDIYGPPVLVVVFLIAMGLSIIYKFPLKK
ncbi:Vacuolar transporter chaperone 4 [Nosema bombycis CQ1]|uniref:Vacuolar transporter chaperone 4 n=1 Tax=Nosema bombycis (strain CQ1 / CVCC 102059) TaxID=578461 RepID=R0MB15_NOSB1|nr:Vacuolar transporter chaperone 4 [Nosema bombycis CQ1]|eukprot:EOB15164.1 Vacuolar transporter chaperone 4 [Nosema bombycis CQ1]